MHYASIGSAISLSLFYLFDLMASTINDFAYKSSFLVLLMDFSSSLSCPISCISDPKGSVSSDLKCLSFLMDKVWFFFF